MVGDKIKKGRALFGSVPRFNLNKKENNYAIGNYVCFSSFSFSRKTASGVDISFPSIISFIAGVIFL
jgi:hypothetical protein